VSPKGPSARQGGDAALLLIAAVVAVTCFGDAQVQVVVEALCIHAVSHHPVRRPAITGAREAFIRHDMLWKSRRSQMWMNSIAALHHASG